MFIIYQHKQGDKQIDFAECFTTEGEAINAAVRYFEEDGEVYYWSPLQRNSVEGYIESPIQDRDKHNGVRRGVDYPATLIGSNTPNNRQGA